MRMIPVVHEGCQLPERSVSNNTQVHDTHEMYNIMFKSRLCTEDVAVDKVRVLTIVSGQKLRQIE